MEDLFAGIDLGTVTTSMTINGPAAVIMAMYIAVGDRTGVARRDLAGTIQNDILKEYQAQKEYLYPPRPVDAPRHRRAALHDRGDAEVAPDLDQRVPHPRGGLHRRARAGVHARERVRLRRGRAARPASRSTTSRRGSRSSSTATSTSSRRSASSAPHAGSGPAGCATCTAPTTSARSGCGSTRRRRARRSPRSSRRTTSPGSRCKGLAAVLGGAQSLHTDSFDEALALPSDKAARIALRTQQIIADETGVALVADPLGGSAYVEWMTDELERQAEEVFSRLRDAGDGSMLEGVYAGIDDGWFVGEIADAAYRYESGISSGARLVVGVNVATDGDDGGQNTLYIGPEVEELQLKRLATVKERRSSDAVAGALARVVADAGDTTVNLMPAFIDAVKADCTLGEISAALETVFGTYREPATA